MPFILPGAVTLTPNPEIPSDPLSQMRDLFGDDPETKARIERYEERHRRRIKKRKQLQRRRGLKARIVNYIRSNPEVIIGPIFVALILLAAWHFG